MSNISKKQSKKKKRIESTKKHRHHLTTVTLLESPFCEIAILWIEFEWLQMKIGWEPRNNNGLLPNALNHIIDLISSYLALSLTDLALLLGSTTKSFKFMALLSGGSRILLQSFAVLFTKSLCCNKNPQ